MDINIVHLTENSRNVNVHTIITKVKYTEAKTFFIQKISTIFIFRAFYLYTLYKIICG